MNQCPKCGQFVKYVRGKRNPYTDEIKDVTGYCSRHGRVALTDWYWEQFFPPPPE